MFLLLTTETNSGNTTISGLPVDTPICLLPMGKAIKAEPMMSVTIVKVVSY